MKKTILLLYFIPLLGFSQINLGPVLTSGLEDAQLFSSNYLNPGFDAVAFNLSNGWYSSAKAKGLGSFEVAIIGNVSFVSGNQQSFELNTNDYNFLEFADGSSIKQVANILGQNDPGITGLVNFMDESGSQQSISFALPQGLSRNGLNFVPSAMLQANVGLIFGTEAIIRALPEFTTSDSKARFYGLGLKHEFTSWIPGADLLPISLATVINYSNFVGRFGLDETPLVEGSGQRIDTRLDTWAFDVVLSTKLPVINFYAGGGYVLANSRYTLQGEYEISSGPNAGEVIVDPIRGTTNISGFRGTLGTRLSLGVFKVFADYSIQEFNTLSVGLGFGI